MYVNHYPQASSQRNWYEAIDRLKQTNVQAILAGHGHLNGQYDFDGIPGIMGRSDMGSADSVGGYNVVCFTNGKAVFEEKKPLTNRVRKWAEAPLFNHHFQNDTVKYARPSYLMNMQYTNVKIQWQYRDAYDIGTGAVLYKQLVIATNTGGRNRCAEHRHREKGMVIYHQRKNLQHTRLIRAFSGGSLYR